VLAAPTPAITPSGASALSLTPNIRVGASRGHFKLTGRAAILGVLILRYVVAIICVAAASDDKPNSH